MPISSVTVSTMAGRCQTKSKPLWTMKAVAAATTQPRWHWRGRWARAPQQPCHRGQQDREQDQAHQPELRRKLEIFVMNVGVQVGAMVGSLPSQVGLSGSGAGERVLVTKVANVVISLRRPD